ncbi:MAG TPA: hypothetical protein VF894_07855 [Anaeromyxobacter sp.]
MAILLAVRDLVFRSRIHAAAERLGVPLRLAPRGTPLSQAARDLGGGTALVDLSEPGVLDEIRLVKQAGGVRVVGFLGHLEVGLAAAARDAGADEILSRGQLVQRLDVLLRDAAEGLPPSV